MARDVVTVRGYREFLRAAARAQPDSRKEVRAALRKVGDIVRVEAVNLFERFSPKSAAGYKVRVRQRGIAVEQSLKKTTGKNPKWGAFQMREALLPARHNTFAASQREFEQALDRIADHFERS